MTADVAWCATHHAETDAGQQVVAHESTPVYVHLGDERHRTSPFATLALGMQELLRDGEVVERAVYFDVSGVSYAAGVDSQQLRALERAAGDLADRLDAAGGAR